jgi:tetraacyldisaccharide 4'-kinase
MKTPGYWYPTGGRVPWQARLLAPLGWLYGAATKRRVAQAPAHQAGVPVVCIGNLTAGGSGKTPVVMALAEWLNAQGWTPGIVSRGYGGSLAGPVKVDPNAHGVDEVGDEPLLLAAFADVWIAKDRAAAVRAAEAAGVDIVLMDDGFQNPGVAKDLSLLVVDARAGFGSGFVIPAGPLREPVEDGLKRADAVVTVGAPKDQDRMATDFGAVPRYRAALHPLETGLPLKGLPVMAFAGIAHPDRFFRMLEEMGADMRGTVALGDHQPLTTALMARLEHDAEGAGAQLVTTEKDAVRLTRAYRSKVLTVPVRLRFEDPDTIDSLVKRVRRS